MNRSAAIAGVVVTVVTGVVSCAPVGSSPATGSAPAASTAAAADTSHAIGLTAEQRTRGWRSLFDGRTTAGWRGYRTPSVPAGWSVVDGTLTKSGPVGDLLSAEKFADFQLAFDWKISHGGNAGVFYRGTEEYDHIYWSAPEYQLLDDSLHADGKNRLTSAGAAYALYSAPAGIVKPADQWNSSLIVVQGNRVQHWLNGQKLLEYDLGSADWEARIKVSKFVAYPRFGRATTGYVGFQGDHEGTLTLRNIRIREIR